MKNSRYRCVTLSLHFSIDDFFDIESWPFLEREVGIPVSQGKSTVSGLLHFPRLWNLMKIFADVSGTCNDVYIFVVHGNGILWWKNKLFPTGPHLYILNHVIIATGNISISMKSNVTGWENQDCLVSDGSYRYVFWKAFKRFQQQMSVYVYYCRVAFIKGGRPCAVTNRPLMQIVNTSKF